MAATRDRLALIENISSIGTEAGGDLRETLDRVVFAIASGMEVEVCSVYLFDPERDRLVLRATIGLDRESVGKVSMRTNEGLVGMVIETMAPVAVPDAISHPRYKYFPETGEEKYHSFRGRADANRQASADRRAGRTDAAPAQVQPQRDRAADAPRPPRSRRSSRISGCARRSPPRSASAKSTAAG